MAAKEENNGLLSKVVKFVRNPTTDWGDLGVQESDRESIYSKQMLKEMIERKRRNDFVRKREFDMLRKMRRSEVMAGQDLTGRPSFFQSSMPSKPDDRATTLKKIDEIEAQMSMQWWKTKQGDSPARAGSSTNFAMSSQLPLDGAGDPSGIAPPRFTAYAKTTPQLLQRDDHGALTEPAGLSPMLDWVAPTAPVALEPAPATSSMHLGKPQAPPVLTAVVTAAPAALAQTALIGAETGVSALTVAVPEVAELAHDPELEEASIRFANGDDDGAEAGLLEVLAPKGSRITHEGTWLTLFDLYRATGKQERFETAAIDFAGRFARSAPQWISLPDLVGGTSSPAAAAPGAPVADWTCPSTFGTQTLATLKLALAKAASPWRLSWVKLNTIDEAAAQGLTQLFTQWIAQPVKLRFIGADNLEKVLGNLTPSGDSAVNQAWWKLRMEALRVMHRPDEFELAALDYCVTYEVSPPSWDGARCDYRSLRADGTAAPGHSLRGNSLRGNLERDSISSGFSTGMGTSDGEPHSTGGSLHLPGVPAASLEGQVLGDSTEVFDRLADGFTGAEAIVIACDRLIRVDFSAAGTLLNWVTARQAEGRRVQFVAVNRLVAEFFNVIGISEHARVTVRVD